MLEGKVAVITGATRGIGRWIAEALLREGMTVFVGSRDSASAATAANELCEESKRHACFP